MGLFGQEEPDEGRKLKTATQFLQVLHSPVDPSGKDKGVREKRGRKGSEVRNEGVRSVRKNGFAKYRELQKEKKKEHGDKKRRGGGFYSQVFLPFEEGIPPLPLRKKIINTFAVAMPTQGLLLCSQL